MGITADRLVPATEGRGGRLGMHGQGPGHHCLPVVQIRGGGELRYITWHHEAECGSPSTVGESTFRATGPPTCGSDSTCTVHLQGGIYNF